MVCRLIRVEWLEGMFIDTVKVWQKEWSYITKPHDEAWAAAPEFRSGSPARLTSWTKKGLDWGSTTKVEVLQKRVSNMIKATATLTIVV